MTREKLENELSKVCLKLRNGENSYYYKTKSGALIFLFENSVSVCNFGVTLLDAEYKKLSVIVNSNMETFLVVRPYGKIKDIICLR